MLDVIACVVNLVQRVSDRAGLEKPEPVELVQDQLLEALKHYVRHRRPNIADQHVFAKLLLKATDLRGLAAKGSCGCFSVRLSVFAKPWLTIVMSLSL